MWDSTCSPDGRVVVLRIFVWNSFYGWMLCNSLWKWDEGLFLSLSLGIGTDCKRAVSMLIVR